MSHAPNTNTLKLINKDFNKGIIRKNIFIFFMLQEQAKHTIFIGVGL